jgi:Mn2+/Fe2+ NRAMP family transporter
MYFVVLTSAGTLHAHGKTSISTARDAAEALRTLAGDGAYWLFSLGLIGAGMLDDCRGACSGRFCGGYGRCRCLRRN